MFSSENEYTKLGADTSLILGKRSRSALPNLHCRGYVNCQIEKMEVYHLHFESMNYCYIVFRALKTVNRLGKLSRNRITNKKVNLF